MIKRPASGPAPPDFQSQQANATVQMSASIKKTLAYLKELKDKYAKTEALRGKSFAVAKLIKHLKSKPVQTKDGLPLDAINSAADALRIQGCGPLFARMIEANVLSSSADSSAASAVSSTGGSKRSRAAQNASHDGSTNLPESPPKRSRPRATESNTSVLRFAKAGTAGCALLVGLLRLSRAAARQSAWESAAEADLTDFELSKQQIISEATPLTETQFGSKAPVSAAYGSYSDGWKSMSSLVNRSLVERRRGRGVGHTSTYALSYIGLVAAEEREAIILSAAAAGASDMGAAVQGGSLQGSAAEVPLQEQQQAVIDLALSSDGSSGDAQSGSGNESEAGEILLDSDEDSMGGRGKPAPGKQHKHVNLDSSGAISSPDDDSDGLEALLGIAPRLPRQRNGGSAPAAQQAASEGAHRKSTHAKARKQTASAAVESPAPQAVPLPGALHSAVRQQWGECDTLFGKSFRGADPGSKMAVFASVHSVLGHGSVCTCAGQCSWKARSVQLVLVVDAREPASVAGVVTAQCASEGIPCVSFALPVGDFVWGVMRSTAAQELAVVAGQCKVVPKHLIKDIKLLGFVTERKRLDDLVNSIVSKVAADGLHRAEQHVVSAGSHSSIAVTGGSGAIRSRFLMQHWTLQRCGLQHVSYILEGTLATLRAVGHVPAEKIIKTTIVESEVAGLAMHSTDSELGSARLLQSQGCILQNELACHANACCEQLVAVQLWVSHVNAVLTRQLSGQREVFQQQLHQLYRMPTSVASAIVSCHPTPLSLRRKLCALGTIAERLRYLTEGLAIDADCSRPSLRVAGLLCELYL